MKYPCVMLTAFQREQVNDRLYRIDPKVPLGAFTRLWRSEHCATINPYGSEGCPYAPEDCSMAFLQAGTLALEAKKSKIGLFKAIARKWGLDRAENKPLAREEYDRTYGQQEGTRGLRGSPRARPADDLAGVQPPPVEPRYGGLPGMARDGALGLRRPTHRLQSMGDLLRGDGAGPRTRAYRGNEVEEGGDHDGDARDPLPSPPPGRLGDQPPSGDPDLHQGSE